MIPSNAEAVAVHDLEKRFGAFTAVNKITFSVKRGEIFGFLGPNGSGKSTTIRMLCGILTPTSGRGQVAGHDIFKEPEEIKKSIGYMSQKFSLYEDLSPYENIRFYLGVYSVPQGEWKERMEWILDMTRLQEVKNRRTRELPHGPWLRVTAPAGHPLSRRTYLRRRPYHPSAFLGFYPSTCGKGNHGICHYPLHGRSTQLRTHRNDQ
jgi:ABC-type multidrug transport system ATPase subunit